MRCRVKPQFERMATMDLERMAKQLLGDSWAEFERVRQYFLHQGESPEYRHVLAVAIQRWEGEPLDGSPLGEWKF